MLHKLTIPENILPRRFHRSLYEHNLLKLIDPSLGDTFFAGAYKLIISKAQGRKGYKSIVMVIGPGYNKNPNGPDGTYLMPNYN